MRVSARTISVVNQETNSTVEVSSSSHLDENRMAWLALALTPSLGPKRILDAFRGLREPSQVFALTLTELEGLNLPAQAAQFIFDGKARRAAEEEWARVAEQGATVVTFSCPEYPERLKEIYDPPPVLWVRGAVHLLSLPFDCSRRHAPSLALWFGHRRDACRAIWLRAGS